MSVLYGSYENVEGSEQYDERVQYVAQPNRGKPAAVNRGVEEMRGTYFALLDADDRLPPRSLERRVGALTVQSDADTAIGGFKVFSEPGTDLFGERPCPCVRNPHRLKHLFSRSYKTPFHFNGCLLHRSLIDRVGQFDRFQDQDYSIRCMENTRGIVLVDAPVYLYRKYRDSPRKRLSARGATLRNRPHVILKNFSGPRSYAYAAGMAVVDVGKLVYEIFSNYEN